MKLNGIRARRTHHASPGVNLSCRSQVLSHAGRAGRHERLVSAADWRSRLRIASHDIPERWRKTWLKAATRAAKRQGTKGLSLETCTSWVRAAARACVPHTCIEGDNSDPEHCPQCAVIAAFDPQ